jgi:Fe-S-cluster-containing hydrogenase component 2
LSADSLRQRLSAPEACVTIVDRGWCVTCPIGGDAAPWSAVVGRLARDLELVERGRDEHRLRVAHAPLDTAKAEPPPAAPVATSGPQLSRRGLFAALANPKTLRPPQAVHLRQADVAPEPVDATALIERFDWLKGLSSSAVLPAALFPAATIADTCCINRVCVRACPTGALQTFAETSRKGIMFDAPLCIACGACAQACPTGSMSISPAAAGLFSGPVVLREERFVTCSRCAADFTPNSDDEEVCPACHKDVDVARLGHALFRPRTAARGDETVT